MCILEHLSPALCLAAPGADGSPRHACASASASSPLLLLNPFFPSTRTPLAGPPCSFIILKYLDMITIAVPPALPACLTVATAIAISRLQQHDIYVSNPSAVTLAGHLNVLCFDKTGTLTEPGLDLQGVVPLAAGSGSGDGGGGGRRQPVFAPMCDATDMPAAYQELLATCHGLAQLGPELVGDPLDQRLFQSTGRPGWVGAGEGGGAGATGHRCCLWSGMPHRRLKELHICSRAAWEWVARLRWVASWL